MKIKSILLFVFVFLMIAVMANAADYKVWMPLLPEELGGLKRSGEPEGMNMEMNGKMWSSLHQEYSADNPERAASVTILGGKDAPGMEGFQAMSSMKMETEDQIIKTIKVSGYNGVFNLEKGEKRGTLMISLRQDLMVILETSPTEDETEIVKLAEQLPLADFVAKAN
jgi:hypothetical protein